MLLRIWSQLAEKMGVHTPKLVIIGRRGWSIEDVANKLDHDEALRPYVIELSQCGDDDLPAWLTHAQALLFPSFTEGQGLPLMEALALGTPVIASNLAVYREFAGDIPDYIDPHDEEAWLNHIIDYATRASPQAALQRQKIGQFHPPVWEDHFRHVDAWLGVPHHPDNMGRATA